MTEEKPGQTLLEQFLAPVDDLGWEADRASFLEWARMRHTGETVVILGTGPSLRLVDLDALGRSGLPVIGANGIGRTHDPIYYVICDPFIYGLHRDVFDASRGTRILSSFTVGECDVRLYYDREDALGFSRDRVYHAENTGFVKLSIACVMGAARVVLAGFDGYVVGASSSHCYDEHHLEMQRVDYEWTGERGRVKGRLMRSAFEHARRQAPRLGVRIELLTPSAMLGDLFPVVDLDLLRA